MMFRDLPIVHWLWWRWCGWLHGYWPGKLGIYHGFALEEIFKACTLDWVLS
jgi:hypothetical protein